MLGEREFAERLRDVLRASFAFGAAWAFDASGEFQEKRGALLSRTGLLEELMKLIDTPEDLGKKDVLEKLGVSDPRTVFGHLTSLLTEVESLLRETKQLDEAMSGVGSAAELFCARQEILDMAQSRFGVSSSVVQSVFVGAKSRDRNVH